MKYYNLTLVSLSLFLTSCATSVRGQKEAIKIFSEPSGAMAVSNIKSNKTNDRFGGYLGCAPTPCKINLSRRSYPVITVSKEGYQPIKFALASGIATSSSSVPEGTLIAGNEKTSQVFAGKSHAIPLGGASIATSLVTFGAAPVIDAASGAHLSLTPNPVSVLLKPVVKGE